MADDARRREMDRLRRLAIEGDEEARRKLEEMEAVSGRTQPGDKPVGAGRTLRRPEPLSKQELEARRVARGTPPGRHPDSVPGLPTREWDAFGLSTSPPPPPPTPRDLPRDPLPGPHRPDPVRRLVDDLAGSLEEGGTRARQELGRENLADMERKNASITRIEAEKARLEEIDDRTRANALALKEQHHQRNLRTLEERGTEQDPAAARAFLDRESERLGLPGLRTPEERKIAHGTYSPSDPTGLEGRMLGLAPEEPEPRRLTARERSQLGQGIAGEDLIDHAIATGQFDRSNLGFAAPGTENERGVRYEEGRDIPGATRVMGPRQARLEDLLSGAEEMDFTGDTAGAAAARAEVQGIRDEQAADMERQRNTTRRSRNARGLTRALSMRERSRPGGVDVSADEQAMIEGMTPAQRDRLTLKRATARGRGRRDMDQRERHRQAWNAEALRRNPDLLDSIGGKPMSEYQRATLGLQRDRLSGYREDRRGDEEWRKLQYQESVRKEAEATRRGDKAEVQSEKKWQAQLHRWNVEDKRAEAAIKTRAGERTEDKDAAAEAKLAAGREKRHDQAIAVQQGIIDNKDGRSTPNQITAAKKERDRLIREGPPGPPSLKIGRAHV